MLLAAALAGTAPAATSSVVVTADIPSAIALDPSACDGGVGSDGVLSFGTVLPNTPARTTDCVVGFASSNDTSQLRAYQADGTGTAMWAYGSGGLDTAWGGAGSVAPVLAGSQSVFDAAMQADGKVVAVGTDGGTPMVVRFNTDGTLDASFDGATVGNGKVAFAAPEGLSTIISIAIDDQGRYLLGGRDGGSTTFNVARMLPTGYLDPTFSGNGEVMVDPGAGSDCLEALTLTPTGDVFIAGKRNCAGYDSVVTMRLTSAGVLDTTYNTTGVRVDDLGAAADEGEDVRVDATNRAYVSGLVNGQGAILRYTAGGALDTTFGAPNGYVRTPGINNGCCIALQPDGKPVMVGTTGSNQWRTFRTTTAGVADTTFGAGGLGAVAPLGAGDPEDFTILGNGRLMAAGWLGGYPGTDQGVAAWRPDGTLDTSWSGDGLDSRSLNAGTDNAAAIVPFPEGRLAVVGYVGAGDPSMFVYDDGGNVSDYVDTASDWDTAPATSMFGVCLKSLTGTVTTLWTANASCPQTDGTYWRGVPSSALPAAKVGNTTAPGAATATFVFGFRPAGSQPASTYVAPIVFEALAPG